MALSSVASNGDDHCHHEVTMTVRRADCFSVVVKKAPGPGGSGVFWLVRCGGQGRGRTADLPLFRRSNRPGRREPADVGRWPTCGGGCLWWLLLLSPLLSAAPPLLVASGPGSQGPATTRERSRAAAIGPTHTLRAGFG
jgi:hypothetical protein